MSWVFLADLHFNKAELKRFKPTTDWILEQLRLNTSLRHIFILGDTLHTRNDVNVEALSTAAEFVRQLSLLPTKPKIHMLVGNHDMYFLQSRNISSLDAFDIEPEEEVKRRNSLDDLEKKVLDSGSVTQKKTIRVYKEITEVEIDRNPVVFIPFHEDPVIIRDYLRNYIERSSATKVSNTIIMGHLALNGCMINGYNEFTNTIKNVKGDLTVPEFLHFKRTFTGHYHHHKTYANRVTYIGAPRQMNYGDCGDTNRGFVTYSPISNDFTLSVNPFGNFYVGINLQELRDLHERPLTEEIRNRYRNKFVRVDLPLDIVDEEVHALIRKLKLGYKIAGYRQFGIIKPVRNGEKDIEDVEIMDAGYKMENIKDLFKQYVDQVEVPSQVLKNEHPDAEIEDSEERNAEWLARKGKKVAHWKRLTINMMNQIMNSADGIESAEDDDKYDDDDDVDVVGTDSATEIEFFQATIDSIEISNFLGISGNMKIHLNQLEPGIWFILGINGSGKSSILEAICWCLYGKVLRKDLAVNGVINDYVAKGKTCSVKVIFKNGYGIKREREMKRNSPQHLMLIEPNGTIIEKGTLVETEKDVVKLLGIDFDTFIRSSILSSAATSNFINGTAIDQRNIIEQLLGFDRLNKYDKQARIFANNFEQCKANLKVKLQALETQLSHAQDKMNSYTQQQAAYQLQIDSLKLKLFEQREILGKLRQQFNQSAEMNKDYDQKLQNATTIIEKLLPEQMKCQDQLQKLMNEQSQLTNYSQAVSRLNQLKSEAEQLQREQIISIKGSVIEAVLDNLLEIANLLTGDIRQKLHAQSIVPLQNYMKSTGLNQREISQHKLHTAIMAMSLKIEKQQAAVQSVNVASWNGNAPEEIILSLNKAQAEIKEKLKHIDNEINSAKNVKLMLEKHGRPVKSDQDLHISIQEAVLAITSLESKIEVITNEAGATNTLREDNSPQIQALESQINDLKERQLTAAGVRLEAGQFCVNALVGGHARVQTSSGFRTFCLKQQIELLNKLLAINMRVMNEDCMNQDLSCRLADGLNLVEDKNGIVMGKRSDGQRRRGQLALFFTFFTIAQRRSLFQAGFLFLDEPFDSLDEAGHYAVQKWITNLWKQPNNPLRHIFIITHGNHLSPQARGFITAELHPNFGSRYAAYSHKDVNIALKGVFDYPIAFEEEAAGKERKRKAIVKIPAIKKKTKIHEDMADCKDD